MPRIPPNQCSPYGTAAAAKRGKKPAETAKVQQRQGDRGSGDDDELATSSPPAAAGSCSPAFPSFIVSRILSQLGSSTIGQRSYG